MRITWSQVTAPRKISQRHDPQYSVAIRFRHLILSPQIFAAKSSRERPHSTGLPSSPDEGGAMYESSHTAGAIRGRSEASSGTRD
jgi:hypothetical protein